MPLSVVEYSTGCFVRAAARVACRATAEPDPTEPQTQVGDLRCPPTEGGADAYTPTSDVI